jgi:hypothetical protein
MRSQEARPVHSSPLLTTPEHLGRVTAQPEAPRWNGRFGGDRSSDVRFKGDEGYTLAFVAMMIIPLMVMVSFAVDLGAWYAQSSRMQRASDSAALAAVVWLPDTAKALAAANAAARANGYDPATYTVTTSMVASNQYDVKITAAAPRYFSKLFAGSFNIERHATAQFNKPIPMGSPANTFGNQVNPDPNLCPQGQPMPQPNTCPASPLLWAAVNGPFDNVQNGDRYSTRCSTTAQGDPALGGSCDLANPTYRTTGYNYAVDVAAGDVGTPITIAAYDAPVYGRILGGRDLDNPANGLQADEEGTVLGPGRMARVGNVTTTNGSAVITSATPLFVANDVGEPIRTGNGGIPGNANILSVASATQATMTLNATATGARDIRVGFDCNPNLAPFNTAAFSSGAAPARAWNANGFTAQHCQAGDDGDNTDMPTGCTTTCTTSRGQMNMDFQLYDNDNVDVTVLYNTPLPTCHVQITTTQAGDMDGDMPGAATYKNKWVTICTFTPLVKGIYPLRVRNSGFGAPADSGNGTNAYSLRALGASSATQFYALDDMSIYTPSPGSSARFYLAQIKPENKGKKIQIDLYDPGDGGGASDYNLQVLAPSAGAPAATPTGGSTIPAANVATYCHYNATPSATKGPATPTNAPTCTVVTKLAAGGSGIYNGNWLRIEIQLDNNYNCGTVAGTDCWWTVKYDFGTAGFPTDRTVWSLQVVGDPVHLVG